MEHRWNTVDRDIYGPVIAQQLPATLADKPELLAKLTAERCTDLNRTGSAAKHTDRGLRCSRAANAHHAIHRVEGVVPGGQVADACWPRGRSPDPARSVSG